MPINRDQSAAKRGPTAVNAGQGDGDIIVNVTGSIAGSTGQNASSRVRLRADVINDVTMTGVDTCTVGDPNPGRVRPGRTLGLFKDAKTTSFPSNISMR